MQLEDPTLEKYRKLARGETGPKESGKEHILFVMGCHTDRGSQFTSDLMTRVNRLLAINHTFTSPYHAMGNGVIERLNGTIKMTLRKLVKEQPKEWDRFLVPLLFALRDGVHEGHGFTPFELVYGRTTRGPMRILRELWTKE